MADAVCEQRGTGAGRIVIARLCALGALLPLAFTLLRFWEGGTDSDFWSFWHAARAAIQGSDVYGSDLVFPYPPHSLFLFIPFGLFPFGWGLLLFNFAGVAFFAWAAKSYLPDQLPLVLAVCSPATLFCLFFGQTDLIVGGLWLLAFRGRWAAVAALTFKPHLGLLSVLSLKSWAQIARVALLVAVLVAASLFAFGARAWFDFFNAAVGQAGMIGVRQRWLVMGVSPAIGYGFWGWILFATAAAFLLSRRVNAFTAATAALLISPYGFHYSMPAASVGLAIAIYCHWTQLRVINRTALAGAFLVPVIVTVGTWWAPPILLWALSVQVGLPQGASTGAMEEASFSIRPRVPSD